MAARQYCADSRDLLNMRQAYHQTCKYMIEALVVGRGTRSSTHSLARSRCSSVFKDGVPVGSLRPDDGGARMECVLWLGASLSPESKCLLVFG